MNKYMHIEKLGNEEVKGLLDGTCWIFSKLDGANTQVHYGNGEPVYGTRNHVIDRSDMGQFDGYVAYMDAHAGLQSLIRMKPEWLLFGEWLIPHTLKGYQDEAWKRWYMFDIWDNVLGRYVEYSEYLSLVLEHGITHVPLISILEKPSEDTLKGLLDTNTELMKEGEIGEGIVIKRYDFVNKYGRTTWGKVVAPRFYAKKATKEKVTEKGLFEQDLVEKYLDVEIVNKSYAILCLGDGWSDSKIPRLLESVWYDFVREELWDLIKKEKMPTIDFKALKVRCYARTKELLPEVFS